MDFVTLVSSIIATSENDGSEFIGALPDMIQRAQDRMMNDLDDQGLVTYSSVAVSNNTAKVSVPSGGEIIKTFSVEIGGSRTQLKHRPYEYLIDYWPVSASTGTPVYYGFKTNTEMRVAPTPSAIDLDACLPTFPFNNHFVPSFPAFKSPVTSKPYLAVTLSPLLPGSSPVNSSVLSIKLDS